MNLIDAMIKTTSLNGTTERPMMKTAMKNAFFFDYNFATHNDNFVKANAIRMMKRKVVSARKKKLQRAKYTQDKQKAAARYPYQPTEAELMIKDIGRHPKYMHSYARRRLNPNTEELYAIYENNKTAWQENRRKQLGNAQKSVHKSMMSGAK